MKFLNFLGSSHLTSNHGLPQALKRHYSELDPLFKSKYCIKLIEGCPGATYNNEQFLDQFLKDVKNQTSDIDHEGQVNIIMLGSNDTRELTSLPADLLKQGLEKFEFKVKKFIEDLLCIKNSTIILLSIIIPREINCCLTDCILEELVR